MCAIYGAIAKYSVRDDVLGGIELLQHRGQEAAGVLFADTAGDQHFLIKRTGRLSNLPPDKISRADGTVGVAHLRYGTTGLNCKSDAQPFWTDYGNIGFVHNGQVENMGALRLALEAAGKQIISSSDGELLLKTFAQAYASSHGSLESRVFDSVRATQRASLGGYSCLLPIHGAGLLAMRDPWGVRPLVMGTKENGHGKIIAFASESCALTLKGYEHIEDIPHGGAVFVTKDLVVHKAVLEQGRRSNCALEIPYFSDSSSRFDYANNPKGVTLNSVRYHLCKIHARNTRHLWNELDMIVPIPESPRPFASGYSAESGVPYKDVIYKSRHVGRIFITPNQGTRHRLADEGFRFDEEAFEGKVVGLADDSIWRGTNLMAVVRKVIGYGAKKVYGLIEFPPVSHPCTMGVDSPNNLIAAGRDIPGLCKEIGLDGLSYATKEDYYEVLGRDTLCFACSDGNYPTDNLIQIR